MQQSITKLKIAITEKLINKKFTLAHTTRCLEGTKGHRVFDICCRVCLIKIDNLCKDTLTLTLQNQNRVNGR